ASGDLTSATAQLATRPEVERVEYDLVLPLAITPSDPDYLLQWHLAKINAPGAWNIATGDPNLILAIVDTSVDATHPDLRNRQIAGFNFVTNNTDANDCCEHGTMMAGVAAAIGNNGIGVTSVTWAGRILPVRVAKPDNDLVS